MYIHTNNCLRKIFSSEFIDKINCDSSNFFSYNNSTSVNGLEKIYDNKFVYGESINCSLNEFIVNLSKLNNTLMRRYLINGDNNIMRDITRLLVLSSINQYENIPSFIIVDKINYEGLSDDKNFSSLISSYINGNFDFEMEYDSYMGNGECRYLFSQIDKLNYRLKDDFLIDSDILDDILGCIKKYYSRKIILSNISPFNKKLLINIFCSKFKKYENDNKVFVKS